MPIRRILALLLASFAQLGCDPCSGVPSCHTDAQVRVTGRFVEWSTGKPVTGVRVEFTRIGGVPLVTESFAAVSDEDGFYTVRATAGEVGESVLAARVSPPGRPSYEVGELRVASSTVHGDGTDVGRWVVDPYLAFVGEVRDRETGEALGEGGGVTFRRTGGIAVEPETFRTSLDPGGRFLITLEASEPGEVVGDLRISHRDLERPRVIEGLVISTAHRDEPIQLSRTIGGGPSLAWVGEVFLRGSPPKPPLEGTLVEFRQTGGIDITPDVVIDSTTPRGAFSLAAAPSGYGEVVGDIVVFLPPPRSPDTIRDVRMETFDEDGQKLLARWGVGPSLAYIGQLRLRAQRTGFPLTDVEVEFRRTGGIDLESDVSRTPVADWGGFAYGLYPFEDGAVEGELVIHPPAPHPPIEVPGTVTLETFRADGQRPAGHVSAGPSLNWAAILYLRSGGGDRELGGAEVQVRRTGGIPISPDTFTVTTESFGGVSLSAFTSTPGDVELELVVDLPDPRGADTIRGITLSTFDGEEQRYAGRWGAGGQINWAVGIRDAETGQGIPDVEVRVERTGGIAVEPDTFTVRTASWGAFPVQVHSEEEGELVVDLVVDGPEGPVRIRDVRIPTFRADELRFFGWFGI